MIKDHFGLLITGDMQQIFVNFLQVRRRSARHRQYIDGIENHGVTAAVRQGAIFLSEQRCVSGALIDRLLRRVPSPPSGRLESFRHQHGQPARGRSFIATVCPTVRASPVACQVSGR
jgi:hypothetical protein